MAQIKIYGLAESLNPIKSALSDALHAVVQETLQLPADKRFHRFFPLATEDFYYSKDRSKRYLILEISLFEGRTLETKRALIRGLIARLTDEFGIAPNDIEITLTETPRENWGIRGVCGDELTLNYHVEV